MVALTGKKNARSKITKKGTNIFFFSVWDMYGEDMEEYATHKTEIRNRFKEAGVALPKELEKNSQNDAMEEMDPSMKAFLDMEKKLKNM